MTQLDLNVLDSGLVHLSSTQHPLPTGRLANQNRSHFADEEAGGVRLVCDGWVCVSWILAHTHCAHAWCSHSPPTKHSPDGLLMAESGVSVPSSVIFSPTSNRLKGSDRMGQLFGPARYTISFQTVWRDSNINEEWVHQCWQNASVGSPPASNPWSWLVCPIAFIYFSLCDCWLLK